MNIERVIRELYCLHIDCGLESYQGVGVTAWVVDERNSRVERQFEVDDLDSVAEWLLSEASRQAESRTDLPNTTTVHALLSELSAGQRKDPKKVSRGERGDRSQAPGTSPGGESGETREAI
jgi:hypothetical protein